MAAAVASGTIAALAGCSGGGEGENTTGASEGEGATSGAVNTEPATSAGEGTTEAGTENETTGGNETADTGTAGSTPSNPGVTGTVVEAQNEDGLTFTSHEFYRDGTTVGVRGVIENTSDQTFSYAEVKASPQSEEEESLGKHYANTAQAGIDSLAPGETWEFNLVFGNTTPEQVAGYRLWATGRTSDESPTPTRTATMNGTANGTSTGNSS